MSGTQALGGRMGRRQTASEDHVTRCLVTCCVIGCLLPAAARGQTALEAPGERLSLDAAIRMAVEHNRSLESARLQVAKAEEELAAAKTRRLPAFDVTLFASQLLTRVDFPFPQGAFGAFPGTGPIPATDTTVTTPRQPNLFVSSQLTQPLTQQKRIGLSILVAEAARDIEQERSQGQLLAVVNSVKRLYFSILETESAIAASDDAISLYRELSRTLESRVAQRVALRSDALDVDAKLAQEEYTRVTRVNSLASQKEQLNLLLGRDVRTT